MTDQKIDDLEIVLTAVAEINQELINGNELPAGQIMTTCAIDYGNFTYNRRRQGLYTAKSFFYGQPYLWAYLGNEDLSSTPGYLRIIAKDFMIPLRQANQAPFKLLHKNGDHYDYYWMLSDLTNLNRFKEKYDNLSQDVYGQMALLLRDARNLHLNQII